MTTTDAALGGRFDIGRVVRTTFGVIRRNGAGFLLLSALMVGLPALVFGFLQFGMIQRVGVSATGLPNYNAPMVLLGIAGFVVTLITGALFQVAVVKTTVGDLNGAKVAPMSGLGLAMRLVLPVIALTIVMIVGVGLGWILLLVPGIILGTMWSVAIPALIVEKRGVFASLKRSRDLTRKHRWKIFALFLIYIIAYFAVYFAVAGLGGAAFAAAEYSLVTIMASTIVGLLSSIVASAGLASIYVELRSVKDGVGPQELATVFD